MTAESSATQRTFYLDAVRALAIFSISCNHAVNRAYENYSGQMAEFQAHSLASNLLKALVTVFSRLGVPLFLMITGALILNKRMDTPQRLKRFYTHNLLGTLITTEIWYFIMFWFILLCNPSNTMLETLSLPQLLDRMLQNQLFLNQVTLGSMWYMPMILCIYTTLPLAAALREKVPVWALCIPLGLVFLQRMAIPAISDFRSLTRGGGCPILCPVRG